MELMKLSGIAQHKNCEITVTGNEFIISGTYYYLIDKEFKKVSNKKDILLIKDYMGLGVLRKRSPKKMFIFIGFAFLLKAVSEIADKIGDIFFMFDTGWTDYFVNACAIISIVVGLMFFFSKKKVYEISFRTKRVCVDEKLFSMSDMKKLDKILLDLR